jgi:hypothetical protein
VTPTPGGRQREALVVVVERILSDQAFRFSPALLRKRITESWQDGRFLYFGSLGFPICELVLNIQEIVLDQCLDGDVLERIWNQEL